MGVGGFLLLAIVFGVLAFDAYQFEASARHNVWAVEPLAREKGVNPLLPAQQSSLKNSRLTGVGSIPGLYGVFVVLAVGSSACAAWVWVH